MSNASVLVKLANVPFWLCEHSMGPNHTHAHRMAVGTSIMAVGVTIAHFGAGFPMPLNFTSDIMGYFIHGVGAVPFLDYFMDHVEKDKQ